MSTRIKGFNMGANEMDAEQKDPRKDLPPAAQRALAEAQARRKAETSSRTPKERPKELGGPKGEEPTRYGDWERGGRAVDF